MTATVVPASHGSGTPPTYLHPEKTVWQRMWVGRWSYLFVLPAVAGFVIFFAYPALLAFVSSFYNYDNFKFKPLETPIYNYLRAFRDPTVKRAYINVIELFVISWFGGQAIALFLALLLNSLRRAGGLFRTLYFVPVVTSITVVAILFQWIFGSDAYNLANAILHTLFSIQPIRWLHETALIIPIIGVVAIWAGLGMNIVLWTAGLRAIPVEYYELALLEGASFWQKLRYITMPLLKPIVLYQAVMGFIGGMKEFGLVFMITAGISNGGAGGFSMFTPTPVIMIYGYGFKQLQMGYASALAYLLTFFLLIFSVLQFRLFGKTTTYE